MNNILYIILGKTHFLPEDLVYFKYENSNICSKFVIFQKNTKLLLSDEKSLN